MKTRSIAQIAQLKCAAKSSAEASHRRAVERYMKSPSLCQRCHQPILVRDGERPSETRFRKFCDRSACKEPDIASRTKEECQKVNIRHHAAMVLFEAKPYRCEVCGYTIIVECCHIRPVKSFPPTALISEINSLSNLAALCPNHHYELDKGIIKL
jgi:hypothetical protein